MIPVRTCSASGFNIPKVYVTTLSPCLFFSFPIFFSACSIVLLYRHTHTSTHPSVVHPSLRARMQTSMQTVSIYMCVRYTTIHQ